MPLSSPPILPYLVTGKCLACLRCGPVEVRVSYVTCGLLDQKSRKKLQPLGPVLQKSQYLHPPGSGSSAEHTFTPCLPSPNLPFILHAPLFYSTTLKCLGFLQTWSAEQLSTAEQRRQQRGTDAAGGNRGRGSKRERGEERDCQKGRNKTAGRGNKYKRVEGERRQGWSVRRGKWERQSVHHGEGTELREGASNSFTTGTIQLLLRVRVERNPCQTACLTNVISSIDDIRCWVPTLNHWQMKRNDAGFSGDSSRKLLAFSTETKPNQSWSHYLSHPNPLLQEELIPYAANCWLLPLNSLFHLRLPCTSQRRLAIIVREIAQTRQLSPLIHMITNKPWIYSSLQSY